VRTRARDGAALSVLFAGVLKAFHLRDVTLLLLVYARPCACLTEASLLGFLCREMLELLLLEYLTPQGTKEKLRIPLALLSTDPPEVIRRLKAVGIQIAPGGQDLVIQYLFQEAARVRQERRR
jgi:hypothetical protein